MVHCQQKSASFMLPFLILLGLLGFGCNGDRSRGPVDDTERRYLADAKAVLVLLNASIEESIHQVSLDFRPTDLVNTPRIFNLFVEYDPEQLELADYDPGVAALEADKEVIVQDDPQRGRIRVLVMAGAVLNTNPISSGTLAQLRFRKKTDEPTELRFDTSVQVAAPAEAMDQITFGPPLAL
jgi:hypothetical protein